MGSTIEIIEKVREALAATDRSAVYAAVPDLHGCYQAAAQAVELLEKLELPAMFLGDYCDRGDSSVKTISVLDEARRKHSNWRFHLGNHEQLLMQCWKQGGDFPPFFTERPAFYEYEQNPELKKEHSDFFAHLYPFTQTKNLVFCHAGVARSYDQPIDRVPVEELVWTYHIDPRWTGKKIVRGHLLTENPQEFETHISCETGVWAPDGFLSIVLIDDSPGASTRMLGWISILRDGTIQGFHKP